MRIASDIRGASERFDGFVVLHGTGEFKRSSFDSTPCHECHSDDSRAEIGRYCCPLGDGADTMAYTASALAFLLHDLNKPVVVTGAQIPLCEYSSDATNNFRGALLSAGMGDLPGESRRRLSVELMARETFVG